MRTAPYPIDQSRTRQDCQMCDLLHIDIERQRSETIDRERSILMMVLLAHRQRMTGNMWRLAAFVGAVWGGLMTWVAMHHG